MAEYQRIVSYLYKYNNGQKGENTGFVRVETRKDGLRLFFHVKDMRMMDERKLKAYFYFHKDGKKKGIFVDEFLCSRGFCEYKRTMPEGSIEGFQELKDMDGMVFYDSRGLLYGTCWDERELGGEEIELPGTEEKQNDKGNNVEITERKTEKDKAKIDKREKDKAKVDKREEDKTEVDEREKDKTEVDETEKNRTEVDKIERTKKEKEGEPELKVMPKTKSPAYELSETELPVEEREHMEEVKDREEEQKQVENGQIESERRERKSNKNGPEENGSTKGREEEVIQSSVERMLSEYPAVPISWDSGLVEAVRIIPEDIAGFPIKDWKYAENGFLIQGYEIHHYLILGRIKMNPNRNLWVIGVPGIYNNREKYLAQIFGFYDYIPMSQGQLKTGGFGFWIAPLSYGNQ